MELKQLSDEDYTERREAIDSATVNYSHGMYFKAYQDLQRAYSIEPINVNILIFSSQLCTKLNPTVQSEAINSLNEMAKNIFNLTSSDSTFLYKAWSWVCQQDLVANQKMAYKIFERLVKLGEEEKIFKVLNRLLDTYKANVKVNVVLQWCINYKAHELNKENIQSLLEKVEKTRIFKLSKTKFEIKETQLSRIEKIIKDGEDLRTETLVKWLKVAMEVGRPKFVAKIYRALYLKDKVEAFKFSEITEPFVIQYFQNKEKLKKKPH